MYTSVGCTDKTRVKSTPKGYVSKGRKFDESPKEGSEMEQTGVISTPKKAVVRKLKVGN